ncbi:MAG: xylose isomerase, partial [Rikenellaceae bacterium]
MSTIFSGINKIKFEGADSKNPLAFRYYDENRIVGGKTLKEQLRFAIAYWHSFCADGGDPFGSATHSFPWNAISDPVASAKLKMDAAFDFFVKIGAPYYCFHDVDLVGGGS